MQKVTPFLWFDNNAEEAINLYTSIFKNSAILGMNRMGDGGPVLTASFQINGQELMALNGGPQFKFNEAFSVFVSVETQAEVDELWEKLSEGGEKGQCGWLKDKFGLSWQIIPTALMQLMSDPNLIKANNVMQAMLQMTKIDIQKLRDAYSKEG